MIEFYITLQSNQEQIQSLPLSPCIPTQAETSHTSWWTSITFYSRKCLCSMIQSESWQRKPRWRFLQHEISLKRVKGWNICAFGTDSGCFCRILSKTWFLDFLLDCTDDAFSSIVSCFFLTNDISLGIIGPKGISSLRNNIRNISPWNLIHVTKVNVQGLIDVISFKTPQYIMLRIVCTMYVFGLLFLQEPSDGREYFFVCSRK